MYLNDAVRHVNYNDLAKNYDAPWRTNLSTDEYLGERLSRSSERPFKVLDVGCGTGAWLLVQTRAWCEKGAEFYGIEPSEGMLKIALAKGINAELVQGPAESLLWESGSFDYLHARHAYHHFTDKMRAFDEMCRVLRPGGVVILFDMVPERMKDWLVYRFFPESYELDRDRFLPLEQLQDEFKRRGLTVRLEMGGWEQKVTIEYVRGFSAGRGTSSLQMLTDEEFKRGMDRIEKELHRDPNAVVVSAEYGGNLIAEKL